MKFFMKVKPEQRANIRLAMKVVVFAFIMLWDLLFVLAAGVAFNAFIGTIPANGIFVLLPVWYLITIVFVGVKVADLGYRRIGKWEWVKQPKNKSEVKAK